MVASKYNGQPTTWSNTTEYHTASRWWHPSTTDSSPHGRRPQHTSPRHTRPYQTVASKYNGQPAMWSKTVAYLTAAYHTPSRRWHPSTMDSPPCGRRLQHTLPWHTTPHQDGGIQVQRTAHHMVKDHSIPYRSIQDLIRWWHPSTTDSPPRGLTPRHTTLQHTTLHQMVASK